MPTAMALLGMGEDDAPYSRISLLRKTPRHLIHSFFTDEYGKSVFNLFDTHALAAYAGHWVFTSDDPGPRRCWSAGQGPSRCWVNGWRRRRCCVLCRCR